MTPEERPLDESLYSLEPEEIRFLSEQTGIQDAQELKKHILKVQAGIYSVSTYCFISVQEELKLCH